MALSQAHEEAKEKYIFLKLLLLLTLRLSSEPLCTYVIGTIMTMTHWYLYKKTNTATYYYNNINYNYKNFRSDIK